MIELDPYTGRWYDDETHQWVEAPSVADDAPMSAGQAIAALLMTPLVFVWVCAEYGIDVLAWLDRLGG